MNEIVKYVDKDLPIEGKLIKKDDAIDGRWLGRSWVSKDEIEITFHIPDKYKQGKING